jgi:hypothetical protein
MKLIFEVKGWGRFLWNLCQDAATSAVGFARWMASRIFNRESEVLDGAALWVYRETFIYGIGIAQFVLEERRQYGDSLTGEQFRRHFEKQREIGFGRRE